MVGVHVESDTLEQLCIRSLFQKAPKTSCIASSPNLRLRAGGEINQPVRTHARSTRHPSPLCTRDFRRTLLESSTPLSGSLVLWFSGSLVLWFSGSLVLWFPGSLVPRAYATVKKHNLWISYLHLHLSLSLSLSFLCWRRIALGLWGRCSCFFGFASGLSLGYFLGLLPWTTSLDYFLPSFSFSLSLFLSFSLSLFLSFFLSSLSFFLLSLFLFLSFSPSFLLSLSPGGGFGVDVRPIFRPTGTPSLDRRNREAMID